MVDLLTARADVAKIKPQREFEVLYGAVVGSSPARFYNGYQSRITTTTRTNDDGDVETYQSCRVTVPTKDGRGIYIDDQIRDTEDDVTWSIVQIELGELRASWILTCESILSTESSGGPGAGDPIVIAIMRLREHADELGTVIRQLVQTSSVVGTIARELATTIFEENERETKDRFVIKFHTRPTWENEIDREEYWVADPEGTQYMIESFTEPDTPTGYLSAVAYQQDQLDVVAP